MSVCPFLLLDFHKNKKTILFSMNSTREINNRDAFQHQSDVLNMLWNNERASMAYNLLVLLTVPLIMTALIMILIEIKVNKLVIDSL